ncbi:MAG: substrate-binding domain-containing protein [bacterium]|nr:substrate-binding domain-containing protein [bacterium]
MKRILTYCIIIFCSFIYGCKFDEIRSVSTTGELSIVVDENFEPLMLDEIKEFERLNPGSKIQLKSVPTNNAIADLINGDTKMIVIGRNLNEDEKALLQKNKLELKEYPFAIDGIGFIVNIKNPVLRITSQDLNKIFSGDFKNWTDIKAQNETQNAEVKSFFKGNKDKIKLFIQRKNSATNKYIQDSVLKNLEYSTTAAVCSTSVQMLNEIRSNESAIGIITMNWLSKGNQDTIDTTVKTLRVSKIRDSGVQQDFAEFHQGLIFNGDYPYRRTVYIFSTDLGIKLSSGFITFLLKSDGQKVVLRNSLVPIYQPVRTIQLN